MDEIYKFIDGQKIPLTEQEVAELNNVDEAVLEAILLEGKSRDVRSERNRLLRMLVDPLAGNVLRWNALTPDQQQAWADYRQALLDLPQQTGFPHKVVWPTKPTEGN